GLGGSQVWRAYPRNLVFARALTNGLRWYCPNVSLGSIYTPEEVAEVDPTAASAAAADAAAGVPVPGASESPPARTNGPVVTLEGLGRALRAEGRPPGPRAV